MFADPWIITLIILYLISAFLLLRALPIAVSTLKNWNVNSASELQLNLERKNYLSSVIIQFGIVIQIFVLFFFLYLVNIHLPQMIKGAMCASGTLRLNAYGYPALYVKMLALFIYLSFLFINHLDQNEPGFPISPKKYWFYFPILLLFIYDFTMTVLYLSNIQADVIATCCSVNFDSYIATGNQLERLRILPQWLYLGGFYVLIIFQIVTIFVFKKRSRFLWMLSGPAFFFITVYALKYHFVKFIYALPSHNCLFDIFWRQYFYVGYWIFGGLFLHLGSLLLLLILTILQPKLNVSYQAYENKFRWLALISIFMMAIILTFYWIHWIY